MAHHEEEKEASLKNYFVPLTTFKVVHIILFVGIIIFFNSLFNGFVGDDEAHVINNPLIRSITNVPNFFTAPYADNNSIEGYHFYRPVMFVCFTLLYMISGLQPFIYHLFQIILHIINVIILFFIFRYYLKLNTAFILALVFLVHPINSETVNYISGLEDVLFFFFGSLAYYLNLRMRNGLRKNVVMTVLLLLSVFSKEAGVLFLPALFFHELLFNKRSVKRIFFMGSAVILIYLFFRLIVADVGYHKTSFAPIMHLSFIERLLTIPSVFLYYLKTFFLPFNLAVSQQWIISSHNISQFYFGSLLLIGIMVLIILVGKNIKNKHKEFYKTYLFFSMWFLIGMGLHSQIFPLDMTVADHWFYFPMVGLLGILSIVFHVYFLKYKNLLTTTLIIFLLILGVVTIMRNANFKDNYSLYSHDIKYSKESTLLEAGLGNELLKRKQYKEAEKHLLKAVHLDPKGSMNWNNLGVYYERIGRLKEAKKAYLTAIKNGNNQAAYQNYVFSLYVNGNPQKAALFAKRGLDIFPTDGSLWQLYAFIEHALKHEDKAIYAARKALQYNPTELNAIIYNRLNQRLSLEIKPIETDEGKILQVCPPSCQ